MRRRDFLRLAALTPAAVLAACRQSTTAVPPTPSAPPRTTSPIQTPARSAPEARPLAWGPIRAAGPDPRRDHTLVADGDGTLYLFGGRSAGAPRADGWALSDGMWTPMPEGPPARFGHNAAFVDGRLLIFGGQAGAGAFFDDLWAYDGRRWRRLGAGGPSPRYGAGGTRVGGSLLVSHGFTDAGRFDDTWSFGGAWEDVSPSGARPLKRCLHRLVHLEAEGRTVLFGGQTNGVPFLGDTWLYDPGARSWEELARPGPSARNLYAAAATETLLYLYGGRSDAGPRDDLWSFDGKRWKKLEPKGRAPSPRDGADAAVAGDRLFLFGGNDGSADQSDLWELGPL